MNKEFWVAGGEFTNVEWLAIKKGTWETFGPFLTREAALVKWREISIKHIDDCYRRYLVTEGAVPLAAPPQV